MYDTTKLVRTVQTKIALEEVCAPQTYSTPRYSIICTPVGPVLQLVPGLSRSATLR